MQKASPPTHLIRSKNGDYLRGRVVAMDDKTLQVEIRLETKDLPRDRISRIIWLHADELDPSKKPAAAVPGDPRAGRPQRRHPPHVLARAGRRTTRSRARATSSAPAASASARSTSS